MSQSELTTCCSEKNKKWFPNFNASFGYLLLPRQLPGNTADKGTFNNELTSGVVVVLLK